MNKSKQKISGNRAVIPTNAGIQFFAAYCLLLTAYLFQ